MDYPLDRATSLKTLEPGSHIGSTSPEFANIAGPFGGATAATLLNSVLIHPDQKGTPTAITVNFCAMIAEGEFAIKTELARSGKYLQHWNITLTQDDTIKATASIVCASRAEGFAHQPAQAPAAKAADDYPSDQLPTPVAWVKQYDFKTVQGTIERATQPHSPLRDAKTVLWMKDASERPADYLTLTAMADAFVLRMLQVRGTLSPMGTVTLTTYFHCTDDEIAELGTSHLLGEADSLRFNNQFHDQQMRLWSADGKLIASGNQLVWYRE